MSIKLSLLAFGALFVSRSYAFVPAGRPFVLATGCATRTAAASGNHPLQAENSSSSSSTTSTESSPKTPILNGKRVLPYKIMTGGIKGQPAVAAVYAILNQSYKRGQEGWDAAVHIGVTQDLDQCLERLVEKFGMEQVAHVRALSFSYPQPAAMQEVASEWKETAVEAGAQLDDSWADDTLNYLYDDDDDDDDDEDEFEMEMNGETIISPFDKSAGSAKDSLSSSASSSPDTPLAFNRENVDKVLDEVRPYLISDGGNVAVERVDEENKNVYLKLEGACGSCSSSTVTMQMGIERTLRENFPDLNEVLEIEADPESKPTELTREAVEEEVSRLSAAVIAMGGAVELLDVEPSTGVIKMMYRGPNKVRQGLELAILDLPFANRVEFTMGDD